MRGARSLIVLLVIAIPLGWYTYYDSTRTPASDTPAKEKVFTVDSEKIEEIAIKAEGGDRSQLRKSGDKGWQIVAPAAAEPDPAEVSGLTMSLSTLEMERVVDENAADLKEYGLAEPRIEVSFKADGQQHVLLLGNKTPPGTDLYAKRASDQKVFLIPAHLETTFNKKPFDLRNKVALKVDREKLDAFEVTAGDKTTKFAKTGGEWQLAAPLQGRGDYSAIEGLLSRFTGLQMKSVVTDEEAKKAGLEKPAATIRIGSGSSQATLVVGAAAGEGAVYARDLSRPVIFTIESSILDDIKKDPSEYRQKDLFDARAFNATRLEIVFSGQTHTFEKTSTKNKEGEDEEKWRQVSPQARDLDQTAFGTLIAAVTGARATAFVDQATAAKASAAPEMTIAIKFDEGKKEERVTLGKSGSDVLAVRSGEPGGARVETSTFDSIVKALQELK